MDYVFVSDIHGSDLTKPYLDFRKDDVIMGVLGDFDRAKIAKQLEWMLKNDDKVLFVPGNHEYAHLFHKRIYSQTMNNQGINSDTMWEEWDNEPNLKNLVMASIESTYKEKYASYKGLAARGITMPLEDNKKMVVMHGAYDGDYNGEPTDLWNRLLTRRDYAKNFAAMKSKGYHLMVRGHDHKPKIAYTVDNAVEIIYPDVEQPTDISNAEMATVTVGALYDGYYTTLNDTQNKRVVTFHKNKDYAFKLSDTPFYEERL